MNLDKKKYQIISWNQFSTTFNYSFDTYNDYSKYLSEIRLYKSDKNQNVYFNEDLIIDFNNDINYVINGNLIIDGNLEININDGIGNFLYVKGNIISDSILLSGYPNVEITNNAVIKNGIVGMYGDDGGCLYIHGEIVSPVIFNCLYFNMIFKNKANAMVVDASYGELDTKYKKNNLSEIILDELFENNEISESTLYNYVKSGKNIIKRQKSFFNKSKIKLPNNLKRSKSSQNDKSIISNNDSEKFSNSQTKNIQNYFLDSQKEKKKKKYTFNDLSKQLKKANLYREKSELLKSLEAYDKGLEIINSGNIKNDYNKIYIHYAKLWVYSKLAYDNSLENKVNYKKLCFNEAKTCLSLIPENYSIWHFTDEGKFHEEVIRYSTNSIAWYIFKTSNEKSKMEYALDILETSCKTTSDPQYYYIFDTKVRILLKLKRRFEAYKIVNKILNKFPNFEDFQDFKTNTDYIYWLENIKD